ncbi:MAG: VOC family protein [Xanthomonadales bacterium]|jgi:predicted enzyme related to lactoylglutathione lyase|nr:VOC family protein [Xanthomonadales bacterium]
MNVNNSINYVEFPARDIEATKTFFTTVFEWSFTDYGSEYTSFKNQGINGGFYKSDNTSSTATGGALLVLYSDTLEDVQERVKGAGGSILKPIFSFPGGRRFHFAEPSGNELAVWSDVEA